MLKKLFVMTGLMLFVSAGPVLAGGVNDAAREAEAELAKAKGEMDAALANYKASEAAELAKLNDQSDGRVLLELQYPAGESPKIFTKGWVFGAKCLYLSDPEAEDAEPEDISGEVNWEGSGAFSPAVGEISRPEFSSEGDNTIILSVNIDGKKITKTYHVEAVSPEGYAHVWSNVICPADAHGCPACPHYVAGPIRTGSPNVTINGQPAARVGDVGQHSECCGTNEFTVAEGDPEVLIDGKPAARDGSKTQHCGGTGSIAGGITKHTGDAPPKILKGRISKENWNENE